MVEKKEKSGFFRALDKVKKLWDAYKIIITLLGLVGIGTSGYFASKPVTRSLMTKAESQIMIDKALEANNAYMELSIKKQIEAEDRKVKIMIKEAIHKHECEYNKSC